MFYYITRDERELQASRHAGGRRGRHRHGHVPVQDGGTRAGRPRVQLLGSGTILREVLAAAELLKNDFGVAAILERAQFHRTAARRHGRRALELLHPTEQARHSYVETCLAERPTVRSIAATDYMRAFADQIRPYRPRRYRSSAPTASAAVGQPRGPARFFEVDRHYVTLAALKPGRRRHGARATVADIAQYGIDAGKPNPPEV